MSSALARSALGAARRRAAFATVALLLAALAWTILDAGHAQARSVDSRTSAGLAGAVMPELTLLPSEGVSAEALFGFSVAISADGSTAVVGAPNDGGAGIGAAWVFTRTGSTWTQQARLTAEESGTGAPCGEEVTTEAEECGFGRSVAISADGNTALIGSPRNKEQSGAAWVFTRAGSSWMRRERLTGGEELGDAHFGRRVALSGDGTTAVVGGAQDAAGRGAVWVFERTGEEFAQRQKLTAPAESGQAFFGGSVAVSRGGNVAIIGAPGNSEYAGAAWVYTRTGEAWAPEKAPLLGGSEETGAGRFGSSVALTADGTTALVGGRTDDARRGAAWTFAKASSGWEQVGPKLTATEEVEGAAFGLSVALSSNGDEALIGGPADAHGTGAAWLFRRVGSSYAQLSAKIAGTKEPRVERVGAAVALSQTGAIGLIGAPRSGTTGAAIAFSGVPEAAPTVTRVTPNSGPEEGGTRVTIEGSGFLPGAKVTIGGEATAVEAISDSKLAATTSATPAGAREVVVSDEYGISSGGPSFTYEAPPIKEPPPKEPPVKEPPKNGAKEEPKSPTGGVLGSTSTSVPAPVLGVSGNIEPAGGVVYVRLPGSKKFVRLTNLEQVPFGTIIDARNGNVSVTTMGAGGLQSMNFYEGEFQLTQGSNGVVVAALYGGNFKVCPTKRERAHIAHASRRRVSRSHVVRKLWASGHGTYSTKGSYATGAVLGTVWLTIDRCNGTGVHVIRDAVLVTNLVTRRHVLVKAGHTYIAKAP